MLSLVTGANWIYSTAYGEFGFLLVLRNPGAKLYIMLTYLVLMFCFPLFHGSCWKYGWFRFELQMKVGGFNPFCCNDPDLDQIPSQKGAAVRYDTLSEPDISWTWCTAWHLFSCHFPAYAKPETCMLLPMAWIYCVYDFQGGIMHWSDYEKEQAYLMASFQYCSNSINWHSVLNYKKNICCSKK